MNAASAMAFTRMNGLGNDFIIIDARDMSLALSGDEVRALADRENNTTRGCDQLLIIHPPHQGGDVFMQIFNADGSEVEACGNGARAVAAFLARDKTHQAMHDTTARLETLGGMLTASTAIQGESTNVSARVRINMPLPIFGDVVSLHKDLPDALQVNMGNPHAVLFLPTGTAGFAAQYGFQLERHKAFPQKANINFASLIENETGDALIRLDTWERGVGLTQACGTGACATAAAAIETGLCNPGKVIIRPPFNKDNNHNDVLLIDYVPETHLTMTGPVAFEFAAQVSL